jgi:hypothetical protein
MANRPYPVVVQPVHIQHPASVFGDLPPKPLLGSRSGLDDDAAVLLPVVVLLARAPSDVGPVAAVEAAGPTLPPAGADMYYYRLSRQRGAQRLFYGLDGGVAQQVRVLLALGDRRGGCWSVDAFVEFGRCRPHEGCRRYVDRLSPDVAVFHRFH